MGIRVIDAQEEGLLAIGNESAGFAGVAQLVIAGKIRFRNGFEIEGKRRLGIDVQFADDSGPVAGVFQAPNDIGCIFSIHAKFPGGQADLAILMRIKSRKECGPGLAATRLGDVGVLKQRSFRS